MLTNANLPTQSSATRLASPQSSQRATLRAAGAGGEQRPEGQSPPHQYVVQIHSTPQSRADRGGQGAADAGRSVVVGTTAPWHQVSRRRLIAGIAPLLALTGGALTYALRAGVVPGNALHRDTYTADRFTEPADDLAALALTAASTLAGAALPSLSAGVGYAAHYFKEWVRLKRSHDDSGQGQLDAIVRQATRSGPLTDAGLRTCIDRLGAVRTGAGGDVEGLRVALAMARLAPVAMRADAGCLGGSPGAQAQLELLLGALELLHRSNRLTLRQFTRSLLTAAEALSDRTPANQQALVTEAILAKFDAVTRNEGVDHLKARADFKVMLRGAKGLATQDEALQLTPGELDACSATRPAPQAELITTFLKSIDRAEDKPAQIDRLVVRLTLGKSTQATQKELTDLSDWLKGVGKSTNGDAALKLAAGRALYLINGHGAPVGADSKAAGDSKHSGASATAHQVSATAQTDALATRAVESEVYWTRASCGILAALRKKLDTTPANPALQCLVREHCTKENLAAALRRASVADVPIEARAAVDLALGKQFSRDATSGTERVATLATIARTLEGRKDLPPGSLLAGLINEEDVRRVIEGTRGLENINAVSHSESLVAMTRLCQLKASPAVQERVASELGRLWIDHQQQRAYGTEVALENRNHYQRQLEQTLTQRLVVDPAMGPLASGLHLPAFRDALAAASTAR